MKCISLTALLSGVGIASGDSTDNVSSRLQVHVRFKIDHSFHGGQIEIRFGFVSCFLYLLSFLYHFVGPLCLQLFHCGRIQYSSNREVHRWLIGLWERSDVGSLKYSSTKYWDG